MKQENSEQYLRKKAFFNQIVTLYGRKPVIEVLKDTKLEVFRLHVADSNRHQGIMEEILQVAQDRGIEVQRHSRQALSRISKNGKQDQGVCVDILCPQHQGFDTFLSDQKGKPGVRIIALDRITNPQNLGMIIRSVCAGNIDGLLLTEKGCAAIDSLVVKASAGTLFRTPLLYCKNLKSALKEAKNHGASVYGLSSHASCSLKEQTESDFSIYVLGNETEGMSQEISRLCDQHLFIPMNNQVESLNVAITAGLIAFKGVI